MEQLFDLYASSDIRPPVDQPGDDNDFIMASSAGDSPIAGDIDMEGESPISTLMKATLSTIRLAEDLINENQRLREELSKPQR